MKSKTAQLTSTHASPVPHPRPAAPFFQKGSPTANHAAPSRPRFEKVSDDVGIGAGISADRAAENAISVSDKGDTAGRNGKIIHLVTPLTVARKAEDEGPKGVPTPIESAPQKTEPTTGEVDTRTTVEALEEVAEPETLPAGTVPSPLPPVLPSGPPVEAVPLVPAPGTASEIGEQFNALPPSAQADAYAGLGAAMDQSVADEATLTQERVPGLHASLEGTAEPPATPFVSVPAVAPSAAGQLYAATPEPVVEIPEPPQQTPLSHPNVPSVPPAEGGSLGQALGTIDPAPAIETSLPPPEIPLEGTADPSALGTLETAAAAEAGSAVADAQAGIRAVTPDVMQPPSLEETVVPPPLTEMAAPGHSPRVEGMDKLNSYALGPLDRSLFDAQVSPTMAAAVATADLEIAQRELDFDQERTAINAAAEAEAAAAQTEAQTKQQLEVDQSRQTLATEQEQTIDRQQQAADDALNQLSTTKAANAQAIDDRLAADRAAVEGIYDTAEADAAAKLEQAAAEAEAEERYAAEQAEAQSWWDWAIDTWQALVQTVASVVVAIWEGVIAVVTGILDRAVEMATAVVTAAVSFVKEVLSNYLNFWTRLIDNLLGSIFPELAAAFKALIEALKVKLFAALDAVAAAYLQALRFIAENLVAGLQAALEFYKAGVAAYLALWEAIQNGQWADVGRTLLSAMLSALGIDPEEFFAIFGKIGEVIDEIIADPTLIGRRAIDALSLGFYQFGANFVGNFIAAFVEWITGAARIVLPKTFSIAGIFDVVCQVLNLTYDYLREKAVQHVGEGAVTAVEELFEAIKTFIAEGWSGLWNLVKNKLTTLVDDVVIAMGTWLVEKAILVAGRWIAGLIATMGWSAIVEGLIALWQFIMWIKDQFQQFYQIVKSTVDSIHEFVKGLIQPAADTIEGTLQDLIVPAIDLVAKLLNIGNIAKKVEQIIESVRQMVDGAIDSLVAFFKEKLGLGGEEEADEEEKGEEELDGAVTLAILQEPPVALPRTKEQERQDLATAHKVLALAEKKVNDTAGLAEYFDAIQGRFRLKSIGFETLSAGMLGVQMSINPDESEPTETLRARDLREGESRDLPAIETEVKLWTQEIHHPTTGQTFTVGKKMEAVPLGPDHPQGTPPGSSHNDLMMHLPTKGSGANRNTDQRKRYIKGHLLNDNVGGPGIPDNLFPMIEYVNLQKFEPAIEQWVKDQVKAGYYVYYRVEIDGNKLDVHNQPKYNRVDSVITAEAGYWLASGKADSARKRASVENKLVGGSDAPEGQGSDPVRHAEAARETGIISDPSSRAATLEDPQAALATRNADAAAATAQEYAQLAERSADLAEDVPELQSARGEMQRWATQATEAAERAAIAAENAHRNKNTDPSTTRISATEAEQAADSARLAEQEGLNVLNRVRKDVVTALRSQVDEVVKDQQKIILDSLTVACQKLSEFTDYAAGLSGTVEEIRATWKLLGKFKKKNHNSKTSKLSSKKTQIAKQTVGLQEHQNQTNAAVQQLALEDLAGQQAETQRRLDAAGSATAEGMATAFVQANLAWSAMLDVSRRIDESSETINNDLEKRSRDLSQLETTLNEYREEIKTYIKQQELSVGDLVKFATTAGAKLLDAEREAALKFLTTEFP